MSYHLAGPELAMANASRAAAGLPPMTQEEMDAGFAFAAHYAAKGAKDVAIASTPPWKVAAAGAFIVGVALYIATQ